MAKDSKIEWTNHTVNLWWGCTKVHAGCDNCYAEVLSKRFDDNVWGNDVPRKKIKSAFSDLAKYQKWAKEGDEIVKVFVGSMMDIFEKPFPMVDHNGEHLGMTTGEVRSMLFDKISKGKYPNLVFLFLTKRPSNINKYTPLEWKTEPPSNVWFGTSPVDTETFNNLVPHLLKVKGNRFLSIEPNLDDVGNVDLTGIDWVIQGGESGHNKRPFDIEWAESLRDVCAKQNVPFFFKQIDKIQEIPSHLMIKEFPNFKR